MRRRPSVSPRGRNKLVDQATLGPRGIDPREAAGVSEAPRDSVYRKIRRKIHSKDSPREYQHGDRREYRAKEICRLSEFPVRVSRKGNPEINSAKGHL